MAVAAGKLRHRIAIEELKETRSDYGEVVREWVPVANVWAQVVPQSGKEFVAAQAIQAQVDTRITIRYRDDITPKHRVVYRSHIYDIRAVLPDDDSGLEHMTLMCQSGVNDG